MSAGGAGSVLNHEIEAVIVALPGALQLPSSISRVSCFSVI
jgi:hypothetical protein